MTKKISKLLLIFSLIILTITSFSMCYATEAVTTSETEGEAVVTSEENATTTEEATEDEIYTGDLYLFDNDIVMDKLVDGNVFIFGGNVEITGQVNGNLFIFADNISFNKSYIRYSIFACANSVYYNGACNDLYVATNKLETTYDSYVVRDLKTVSSNVIFRAAIGRDADLITNTIDFGTETDIPVVYGNLRYTANTEYELPKGVLTDESTVVYTKPSEINTTISSSIADILIGFATCIVTVLIVYLLTKKATPKFAEKLENSKLSVLRLLKSFGLGLASLIAVSLIFILLLLTAIGAKLSIILILVYAILCLLASPILTIAITNILKPVLKIEKTSMLYLVLVLVSIILHGLTLIPFVGGLLGFVIKMITIGLLIDMYLPHKELTDEEKAAREEAKKQAREIKEKAKQEKLEAKATKKQAKLAEKEGPIKENED